MIIKIRQGTFDTDTLSLEQLIELRNSIQDSVINMDSKMKEVSLKAHSLREFADPQWFKTLNFALRTYQKHSQTLAEIISKKKKEENIIRSEERNRQFDEQFYLVCKEKLDPYLLRQIIEETRIRAGQ